MFGLLAGGGAAVSETATTGSWGEGLALAEARRRGYRWVASNVRCRFGEIDLVLRDGEILVFVEVKTRKWGIGQGQRAVDGRKRRRLELAARGYLARRPADAERVCRFDVCVVTPGPTVTWYEDAFQPGG
jgi:putative endonuclease